MNPMSMNFPYAIPALQKRSPDLRPRSDPPAYASRMEIARLTDLSNLDIAPDFFAIHRSAEVREALSKLFALDAYLVGAIDRSVLVGYAVDLPFLPIEFEGEKIERRWNRLPDARELGAIEIARQCRSRGVARELLAGLAENGRLETKIVVGEGLMWHWDYESRGLNASECRARLLSMFAGAGYRRFRTNEPEIAFSPYNFLVARIGRQVSKSSLGAFEAALIA
jgi:GNAT superfamily N-acetyltransferase